MNETGTWWQVKLQDVVQLESLPLPEGETDSAGLSLPPDRQFPTQGSPRPGLGGVRPAGLRRPMEAPGPLFGGVQPR